MHTNAHSPNPRLDQVIKARTVLAGVGANQDGLEQANMGVAIGDYLRERRMSLLISHFDNEYAALYHNEGGMNFADASIGSEIAGGTQGCVGWGSAFVDFDNELLFRNRRDATFENISRRVGPALQIPLVSRGLAVGDLFNDGKMEAVVENLVGRPMILRPVGGPQNHWISFQLEGVKCNRLALNARIQATAGDLVQLGEVLSGGSYLSQHPLRAGQSRACRSG